MSEKTDASVFTYSRRWEVWQTDDIYEYYLNKMYVCPDYMVVAHTGGTELSVDTEPVDYTRQFDDQTVRIVSESCVIDLKPLPGGDFITGFSRFPEDCLLVGFIVRIDTQGEIPLTEAKSIEEESEGREQSRPDVSPDPDNPWMTPKEAAVYVMSTPGSLSTMRTNGSGPKYYKPSNRRVLYKKSDLDTWLESGKKDPTARHKETPQE